VRGKWNSPDSERLVGGLNPFLSDHSFFHYAAVTHIDRPMNDDVLDTVRVLDNVADGDTAPGMLRLLLLT